MIKEWFVFKGTHHLGPFSIEEMVNLYTNKELQAKTLVWKEGAAKWDAFSKCDQFAFLFQAVRPAAPSVPDIADQQVKKSAMVEFDLPPPLPEIPTLPKSGPEKIVVSDFFDDMDLPPPIPLDAILDPKGKDSFKPSFQLLNLPIKKWFMPMAGVVFLIIIGWYAMTQKEAEIQLRIKGLMPVYLDKLESIATKSTTDFDFAIALSLDGKSLWASSNVPGDLQTEVKLESVSRRVLGTEDVQLVVKGKIQNHVGKFNRMILVKGSKFLPGEYKFKILAKQTHYLNRRFKQLAALSFFRTLNKTYELNGSTLIYSGTPREFEKRISDYLSTIISDQLKPFQEKLESIQTLESLLNATSQNYLMELDRDKNGKSIALFEKKFIKDISPMLQSLILKNNEFANDPALNELGNTNSIAPYREQVLLGKQIGEMASEMITKTSKYKSLSSSAKVLLKAEFERKAKAIKLQIDLNAKKLEDKIQKISKP